MLLNRALPYKLLIIYVLVCVGGWHSASFPTFTLQNYILYKYCARILCYYFHIVNKLTEYPGLLTIDFFTQKSNKLQNRG